MGNFLFNAKSVEQDSPWFYGYMVNLEISKGKSIKYELIPYKTEKDTAIIHVFEGEKKEKMLSEIFSEIQKIIARY
jgi:hypothetical protein